MIDKPTARDTVNAEQARTRAQRADAVRFALSAAYREFERAWEWMPCGRSQWIKKWAVAMADYTPQEIQAATRRCLKTLSRPPTLSEFEGYCRDLTGRRSKPSIAEMARCIALEIEESCEQEDRCAVSQADALLLAAVLVLARVSESEGIEWNDMTLALDYTERSGRYGEHALKLVDAAKAGYGDWAGLFGDGIANRRL